MMNKLLVFFSLFLIVSMGFVTIPNIIHADSQLDILVKIIQNTKEHIKNDIDKLDNISPKVYDFYDEGSRETVLLTQAVENGDTESAKQHFISAMIAFKHTSLAISENESQETPQMVTSVHNQTNKSDSPKQFEKPRALDVCYALYFLLISPFLVFKRSHNW